MNRVQILLQEIKNRIPMEILNRAFIVEEGLGILNTSLDHRIKTTIIDSRVRLDLDLMGGEVQDIEMFNCRQTVIGNGVRIDIPINLTGGRALTSVLSASYGLNYENTSGPTIASSVHQQPPSVMTKIHVINDNSIYIAGLYNVNITAIKCLLTNDANFNNINIRYMKYIGKLSTMATKAYIYNTMSLRLSNATVVEGESLAAISAKVESYADAQELYDTELKLWKSISILNDEKASNDFHRLITP